MKIEKSMGMANKFSPAARETNTALENRIMVLEAQIRAKKLKLQSADSSHKVALETEIARLESDLQKLKARLKKGPEI